MRRGANRMAWSARIMRAAAGASVCVLLTACAGTAGTDAHPLLRAVCRGDYAAAAAQSPQTLDLTAIASARGLTALDLALADGHWEIATLLLYSGAQVTAGTLNHICRIDHAAALCKRDAALRHHPTCRAVEEPSRWNRTCRPPSRDCRRILDASD